jgi:MFS family permease
MQSVLFAWIVVHDLAADPEWVGVAQFSVMLPSLLVLPLGGALADRRDPRGVLSLVHVLAALPPLALAAALASRALGLPGLLCFAVGVGALSGFAQPSRDTLLSRVAAGDMMRAVTGATAIQFGAQAAGTLLAGLARVVGAPAMLCVQALVMACGALAARSLPAAGPAVGAAGGRLSWHELTLGLRVVARTPALRNPILLTIAVGLFFMGPFLVCFPLVVRNVYGGGVEQLSTMMMMFPLGTIAGSLLLRARGGVERKGLAALAALAFGACALGAIGLALPFWAAVAATGAWGLGGAVFITASRTLTQEAAPEPHRGRVLSVYQMGFMGAAPIGALASGLVSGRIGELYTLQLASLSMLGVAALMARFTEVAKAR